eukprot:113154-Karenia_brevis.AAC.1
MCRIHESTIQSIKIGNQIHYWVQSIHVSTDKGGRVWTKEADGVTWMNLGGDKMSSVCGRLVQICWGHSRDEILMALQLFGE